MDWEGEIEWDPKAEEELRAIEAAYSTKRRSSDPEAHDDHRPSKDRRLPDWGNPSRVPAVDHSPRNQGNGSGLWSLAPPPCRVAADLKVRYPAMNFGGRIVYCRTTPEVDQATKELWDKIEVMKERMDPISIGFDIEWKPALTRGAVPRKAAVMQICMDNANCYVMHIIHSGIPLILKSLLEDYSSVKVGLAISNDAKKILQDYNVSVEPVEDLSGFANVKLGGAPRRWSLCSLTEMLSCKQLAKPKGIRLGNWEANVLSRKQLQYAATDAYVSWYLYQVLKAFPDVKTDNQHNHKDS